MAKTIEELRAQSQTVKNASTVGENTAMRVGTLFDDIVGHVQDYETAQSASDEDLSNRINSEANRAKGAEEALQRNIELEAEARANAIKEEENARNQAIEVETLRAKQVEDSLRQGLHNEVERATGAEGSLSNRIAEEASRAKGVESTLQSNIGNEVLRATQAEQVLSNKIAAEVERAKTEEEALDNAIKAEAAARGNADKELNTKIEAEVERATAAEEANTQAIAKRGIYDVSAYNGGAVFESLSSLLNNANLSTLIPASVRCGGMSIRFIQGSVPNSDNKYVQYRYMGTYTANANFTNTDNWQGVDDEPTAISENLVKSGGVFNFVNDIVGDNYDIHKEVSQSTLNAYIGLDGTIVAFERYRVSQPILVKAGYKVTTQKKGHDIAYIAKVSSATPIEIGDVVEVLSDVQAKSFITTEDTYLIFSWSKESNDAPIFLKKLNGFDGRITRIETFDGTINTNIVPSSVIYPAYTLNPNVNTNNKTITFPTDFTISDNGRNYYLTSSVTIGLILAEVRVVYIFFNWSNYTFESSTYMFNKGKNYSFILAVNRITGETTLPPDKYMVNGVLAINVIMTPALENSLDKSKNYTEYYTKVETGIGYNIFDDLNYISSGCYIDVTTGVITAYSSYKVSQPILVKAGYTVYNNCIGTKVAFIAKTNSADNINIGDTVILLSAPGTRTFSADEDTYVVFCFNNNTPIERRNIELKLTDSIVADINNLDKRIDNLEGKSDVLGNNKNELILKLEQLRRGYNDWQGHIATNVVFLHFSDLHGDATRLKRIVDFKGEYSTYIADAIHTGDSVVDHYGNDFAFWNNAGAGAFLNVIGNHDVVTVEDGHYGPNVSIVTYYNTYFAPYIASWNVVQPSNAAANGLCYYYKDYVNSIRLIVLDCAYFDDNQATWLENVLADARTNNLAVICASHFRAGQLTKVNGCTFNSLDYFNTSDNILDSRAPALVDDFQQAGGTFIAWIGGHAHYDMTAVLTDYPAQFQIIIENASKNSYWNDDSRNGEKAQDCFNLFSVDTTKKVIRVTRIGVDYDRYLQHKGSFAYDYGNHQLIINN